MTRGSSRF